jgi:methyltransferase (TIGR00027 family)
MGAAYCRLIEQSQPSGLRQFDDPIVGRLLDPMLTALAGAGPMQAQMLAAIGTGTYGCQVMRTRYIDDVVVAEAALDVTQLVLLGAGLDTRAYRLPDLQAVTVFEVDLPALQRRKQRRLRGTSPTAREVRFVPLDLDTQSLDAALIAAGFDRSRPVLFVWEGVTHLGSAAAGGSRA